MLSRVAPRPCRWAALWFFLFSGLSLAEDGRSNHLLSQVQDDFQRFYSWPTLNLMLPNVLVGAAMANSNVDGWLQDQWRQESKSHPARGAKLNTIGDLSRTVPALPIYLTIMAADHYLSTTPSQLGRWANYSFRTFLVAAPGALATAHLAGAGRPTEGDSQWQPLADNNAVSGHAFAGAIPFINAALMAESPLSKGVFYGLSVLPAMARVELDAHYASQAFLGWTFAYISAKVVQQQASLAGFSVAFNGKQASVNYRFEF